MDSESTLPAAGPVRTPHLSRSLGAAGRWAEDIYARIYAAFSEWKFGVTTHGLIQPSELRITSPDATGYSALEYPHVAWAIQTIPFPPAEVAFVDYGAGKGRVLAVAATRPFRKVIGIEISEDLAGIARRNLESVKQRRAAQVEIYCSDAALFPVPDDANVFFFFNPFIGETLNEVIYRIYQSWCSHPRDLFVIFFNHREFDQCVRGHSWLRKIHETAACGLYRSL